MNVGQWYTRMRSYNSRGHALLFTRWDLLLGAGGIYTIDFTTGLLLAVTWNLFATGLGYRDWWKWKTLAYEQKFITEQNQIIMDIHANKIHRKK